MYVMTDEERAELRGSDLQYPVKEDHILYYVTSRGEKLGIVQWDKNGLIFHESTPALKKLFSGGEKVLSVEQFKRALREYTVEKDYNEQAYLEEVRAYHAIINERIEKWKQRVFAYYGVTDNPKVDKCYSLAYDKGHSAGLEEVLSYFDDFVELIV